MAIVFNQALGRINEIHRRVNNNDPASAVLVAMLLQATTEADATLKDRDSFADILAGNTECNATGYARIVLDDTDISATTVDDGTDTRSADIADLAWAALGGAVNNDLDKLVLGFDQDSTTGTDADIVPLIADDFLIGGNPVPTNGGDITAVIAATGYFSAS